jgi:hypothetical protein
LEVTADRLAVKSVDDDFEVWGKVDGIVVLKWRGDDLEIGGGGLGVCGRVAGTLRRATLYQRQNAFDRTTVARRVPPIRNRTGPRVRTLSTEHRAAIHAKPSAGTHTGSGAQHQQIDPDLLHSRSRQGSARYTAPCGRPCPSSLDAVPAWAHGVVAKVGK